MSSTFYLPPVIKDWFSKARCPEEYWIADKLGKGYCPMCWAALHAYDSTSGDKAYTSSSDDTCDRCGRSPGRISSFTKAIIDASFGDKSTALIMCRDGTKRSFPGLQGNPSMYAVAYGEVERFFYLKQLDPLQK